MTTIRKQKSPALHWSGCSDVGRFRQNNEDAFLGLQFDAQEVFRLGKFGTGATADNDYAFAVCDGMGGAKAGEFASNIAVEKITRLLPQTFRKISADEPKATAVLNELFSQIHRALVYLGGSYEEIEGMQTTMSLGWFSPGKMIFGHIGDSRIEGFEYRQQKAQCFTRTGGRKQHHIATYVGIERRVLHLVQFGYVEFCEGFFYHCGAKVRVFELGVSGCEVWVVYLFKNCWRNLTNTRNR